MEYWKSAKCDIFCRDFYNKYNMATCNWLFLLSTFEVFVLFHYIWCCILEIKCIILCLIHVENIFIILSMLYSLYLIVFLFLCTFKENIVWFTGLSNYFFNQIYPSGLFGGCLSLNHLTFWFSRCSVVWWVFIYYSLTT